MDASGVDGNKYHRSNPVLGGNLVPKQFSYEDSPAGRECVVVGSTEFSGEHRAVHILPNGRVFSTDSYSVKDVKTARMHPYPQIWTYHGTIDDLYLQIQIERIINAALVTPIHFTGFEKTGDFQWYGIPFLRQQLHKLLSRCA